MPRARGHQLFQLMVVPLVSEMVGERVRCVGDRWVLRGWVNVVSDAHPVKAMDKCGGGEHDGLVWVDVVEYCSA